MERQLLAVLGDHPWQNTVTVLKTVDSTNTFAKALARQGAPHGTVVLAEQQTAGRGRLGRSFSSPASMGIYCSVILRPKEPPRALLHLTAMMAEAARRAIAESTGLHPMVKWVNDLILEGKKLCGILTELEATPEQTDFVIVGVGINCGQCREDFPPELQDMATSLSMALGQPADRAQVAAALIRQIALAAENLTADPKPWMDGYRSHCITLGSPVQVIQNGLTRPGYAENIDETGALLVRFPDGTRETIASGEVSVRGLYGYV